MGRPKGSKNKSKQRTDNRVALVEDKKPTQIKAGKNDGFKHGPCGEFWPADSPSCPFCHSKA